MPDEILTSLAGRRVRIVNTDAEGRVVLTDMLYYAKEEVSTLQKHLLAFLLYQTMNPTLIIDNEHGYRLKVRGGLHGC